MSDSIDLRQYIALGLKWWWLIILLSVVAAATGYAVSQRQPRVYRASTTIMIGQSVIQATDNFDISTSQQLAQTYADMTQRQPVLQGVVETLSLRDTWQALKGRVQAKPAPGTQLLEITVEASSPQEAQVTADEIAHQLILLSPTEQQEREKADNQRFGRQRLEKLQAKIEAGEERLAALETELDTPLSIEQAEKLQAEVDKLDNLIADWENNYTQLLIFIEGERSPNYLAVIEPAQANPRPIRPKTSQDTLLAGVVGLMLALGLIFLLEYLDDTLKSRADLSQSLGLTPLGAISRIKGKNYPDKLMTTQDQFSPVAEAYRMVRSNIQFASVDRPIQSIMVTSPTPSEGKSITVANLGIAMAQAGLKTIIVDADLRRPVLHEIFQAPNLGGLTELICSPESEVDGHLRKTGVENLQLITSGVLPPNPSELLGSQRMGQLLASLRELADVIIFDSPPALAVADTAVLSNRVDGVVLVAEAGQTRRDAARQALANLHQADAHMLGGVLNRVSGKKGGYYYYHRYYAPNGRLPAGQPAPQVRPRRRWQWLPFFK